MTDLTLDSRLFAALIVNDILERDPGINVMTYGTDKSMLIAIGEVHSLTIYSECYSYSFLGKRKINPIDFNVWEHLADFLRIAEQQYVTGYIGFDLHSTSTSGLQKAIYPSTSLVVPKVVLSIQGRRCNCLIGDASPLEPIIDKLARSKDVLSFSCKNLISPVDFDSAPADKFMRKVNFILDWISNAPQRRATLARKVVLDRDIDIIKSMACTRMGPSMSRCFYLHSSELEFVGNSPELLAVGIRSLFKTYKLSGTYARSSDSAHDAALLEELLQNEKILEEHRLSIESLHSSLAKIGIVQQTKPSVLELTTLRHLMTVFETKPNHDQLVIDCLRAK